MNYQLDELKKIIEESDNIVFFGGAGVSTESGIPDFRGTGGLYTNGTEDDEGLTPEEKIHIDYLCLNPKGFFEYYKENLIYSDAEPNDGHYALARLEEKGKLKAIVTQNIDGLHQKAGSKKVYELHGTVEKNYCSICGKSFGVDYVLESYPVPYCDECDGIVRPDVVLYGEGLDQRVWEEAEKAIEECDTLIIAGTSLTVYPACLLVDSFKGENLIIINMSPTLKDGEAKLVINEPVGEALKYATKDI